MKTDNSSSVTAPKIGFFGALGIAVATLISAYLMLISNDGLGI